VSQLHLISALDLAAPPIANTTNELLSQSIFVPVTFSTALSSSMWNVVESTSRNLHLSKNPTFQSPALTNHGDIFMDTATVSGC
jgi:hypothetical protein